MSPNLPTSSSTASDDKEQYADHHLEKPVDVDAKDAGLAGHFATDEHGNSLIYLDPKAEAALRWKIDWHVIPIISLLYLCCFIDRANIGNAKLAGLEKSLGMTGLDYNILLTAFYAPYVVFEIPCNMLNKTFGPGKTIPVFSFLFGLFAMCTGFCNSFGAAIPVRMLLGIAESAVFPGIAYYLSRWYKKDELAFRLALYVVCAPLAGAFGGLLASAILLIPSIGTLTTWRMIFVLEGLATMLIAIASWFIMSDSIDVAPWLTPEEKAMANARVKSENVGATVVLDKFSSKVFMSGIFNTTTLTIGLIFLLDNITVQGLGFFLPTIMKTIYPTDSVVSLQLKTVPPYIVGAFATLLFPFLSGILRRRALLFVICAPFIMLGYAMFVGTTNPQIRYAATFMIAIGAFSFGALCTAWAAINVASDGARNSAIATVVMMGNTGGLIATWSYLPQYAPNYYPGNGLNLATATLILFLSIYLWVWQVRQNKIKERGDHDHVLEGKTVAEIELLGTAHPGFRYRH